MLNKYIYAELKALWEAIVGNTDLLVLEAQHDSDLFPTESDEAITLTAGGVANTFGAWAEIAVDVTGETFSSRFAAQVGHISGFLIEDLSHKDKRYVVEIAHGDAKSGITKHRFVAGQVKLLAAIQSVRVRAQDMPAGEVIYYRMMSEQAGATCEISFRYHYH